MRWVFAFLVACTPQMSGPAWPKAHAHEHDGGESLAPHARVEMAAQLEAEPAPAPPPQETPLAPVAKPVADEPPPAQTDDGQVQVLMTEEVIEIKEDE
jgi:hypothetical protein